MGGGTVLILILTQIFNIDQHIAQATNLVFFAPTSIAAIIVHIKNKNINKKIAMQLLLTGIIGAFIGSYVATIIEANKLKKIFGIFLLIIGFYGIFAQILKYKKGKKEQ